MPDFSLCFGCHQVRPAPIGSGWLPSHCDLCRRALWLALCAACHVPTEVPA